MRAGISGYLRCADDTALVDILSNKEGFLLLVSLYICKAVLEGIKGIIRNRVTLLVMQIVKKRFIDKQNQRVGILGNGP